MERSKNTIVLEPVKSIHAHLGATVVAFSEISAQYNNKTHDKHSSLPAGQHTTMHHRLARDRLRARYHRPSRSFLDIASFFFLASSCAAKPGTPVAPFFAISCVFSSAFSFCRAASMSRMSCTSLSVMGIRVGSRRIMVAKRHWQIFRRALSCAVAQIF